MEDYSKKFKNFGAFLDYIRDLVYSVDLQKVEALKSEDNTLTESYLFFAGCYDKTSKKRGGQGEERIAYWASFQRDKHMENQPIRWSDRIYISVWSEYGRYHFVNQKNSGTSVQHTIPCNDKRKYAPFENLYPSVRPMSELKPSYKGFADSIEGVMMQEAKNQKVFYTQTLDFEGKKAVKTSFADHKLYKPQRKELRPMHQAFVEKWHRIANKRKDLFSKFVELSELYAEYRQKEMDLAALKEFEYLADVENQKKHTVKIMKEHGLIFDPTRTAKFNEALKNATDKRLSLLQKGTYDTPLFELELYDINSDLLKKEGVKIFFEGIKNKMIREWFTDNQGSLLRKRQMIENGFFYGQWDKLLSEYKNPIFVYALADLLVVCNRLGVESVEELLKIETNTLLRYFDKTDFMFFNRFGNPKLQKSNIADLLKDKETLKDFTEVLQNKSSYCGGRSCSDCRAKQICELFTSFSRLQTV